MMKVLKIINLDNKNILADKARQADNFPARLRGLLGKKELPPGEGLIIYPCAMVHCLGMKMDIDVLFVSAANEIVNIIERMTPGKISPYVKKARYVVELPAGQVARTSTAVGHQILLSEFNL